MKRWNITDKRKSPPKRQLRRRKAVIKISLTTVYPKTTEKLKPILSNKIIFGVDLYEAGLGYKIENMVKEELAGVGAVRSTLKKYLSNI